MTDRNIVIQHSGESVILTEDNWKAVVTRIKQLEKLSSRLATAIGSFQEQISYAYQGDLEQGIKWMNEEASREFHEKYPSIAAALNRILDYDIED